MKNFMQNKGITIVELVVGVGVLAFAIAGPMTLAASSLKATQEARNELIATHLAEEGLEVIHSVRDNNSAHDLTPSTTVPPYTGWTKLNVDMITPCSGNGCIVDVTAHTPLIWAPSALVGCVNVGCVSENTVYFNPSTSLYKQNLTAPGAPWIPSIFTRTVLVSVIGATREVQVTSTVTYPGSHGGTRTITVSEVLYNWFPALQ